MKRQNFQQNFAMPSHLLCCELSRFRLCLSRPFSFLINPHRRLLLSCFHFIIIPHNAARIYIHTYTHSHTHDLHWTLRAKEESLLPPSTNSTYLPNSHQPRLTTLPSIRSIRLSVRTFVPRRSSGSSKAVRFAWKRAGHSLSQSHTHIHTHIHHCHRRLFTLSTSFASRPRQHTASSATSLLPPSDTNSRQRDDGSGFVGFAS